MNEKKQSRRVRMIAWVSVIGILVLIVALLYRDYRKYSELELSAASVQPTNQAVPPQQKNNSATMSLPLSIPAQMSTQEAPTQDRPASDHGVTSYIPKDGPVLEFPSGASIGTIYYIGRNAVEEGSWANIGNWSILGPARGKVTVPSGVLIKLVASRSADLDVTVLRNLPSDVIHALVLSGTRIDDERTAALTHFTSLFHLDLSETAIGDSALETISGIKSLRSINLSSTGVTSAGLRHLQRIPELQSLDLTYIRGLTEEGVSQIAELKTLEHVRIGESLYVKDEKKNPSQRRKDEQIHLGDSAIRELTKLEKLHTLYLEMIALSDEGMNHLSKLTSVRELALITVLQRWDASGRNLESRISPESAKLLGSLPSIEKLWVYPLDAEMAPAVIEAAGNLRSLRVLSFQASDGAYAAGLSKASMPFLGKLDQIEDLVIGANYKENLSGADWSGISSMHALKRLRVSNIVPADACAEHLGKLTRLETLTLDGVDLSDKGLAKLRGLTSLKELRISLLRYDDQRKLRPRLTDNGVASLGSMDQLELLSLEGCSVSDDGLATVASLPALRSLDLRGTNLNMVRFSEVFGSSDWPEVRTWITKYRFSGSDNIKLATQLRYLVVDKYKVTAYDVMELQKALPNCRIVRAGAPR